LTHILKLRDNQSALEEAKQMTRETYKIISMAIRDGFYDKTVEGESGEVLLKRTTTDGLANDALTPQEASRLLNEFSDRVRSQLQHT
jgi:hypothetical protein